MKKIILSLIAVMATLCMNAQVFKVYDSKAADPTTPVAEYINNNSHSYRVELSKIPTISVTSQKAYFIDCSVFHCGTVNSPVEFVKGSFTISIAGTQYILPWDESEEDWRISDDYIVGFNNNNELFLDMNDCHDGYFELVSYTDENGITYPIKGTSYITVENAKIYEDDMSDEFWKITSTNVSFNKGYFIVSVAGNQYEIHWNATEDRWQEPTDDPTYGLMYIEIQNDNTIHLYMNDCATGYFEILTYIDGNGVAYNISSQSNSN